MNTLGFLKEAEEVYNLYKNKNVTIEKFVGEELVENRLNLIFAVGKGASVPPAMVNLSYNGNKASKDWHAIIGKGVVYDTGGLNLKPTGSMETMYTDKAGASAV